jgi:hypothetical protein
VSGLSFHCGLRSFFSPSVRYLTSLATAKSYDADQDGLQPLVLKCAMSPRSSRVTYDDWVVCVAILPVLLTLIGLGVTVAVAWHQQTPWKLSPPSAVRDSDGYVQGAVRHSVVLDVELLAGP